MQQRPHALPLGLARISAAFLAAIALWLFWAAAPAHAQVLPIPGLPDALGGVGGGQPAQPAQPTPEAPTETAPGESAAPRAGGSPTEALIDILRDEAAREALIRELEAAAAGAADGAGAAASDGGAQPPDGVAAPAPAPAAPAADNTIGARAADATRQVARWLVDELGQIWLRVQRIPSTVALSARAFEGNALIEAVHRIAPLALAIYTSLIVLRLIARPLRRRMLPKRPDPNWFNRVFRRLGASALDLVTLPLAVFAGIFALFALGLVQADENGQAQLSDSGALFIYAFAAVEISAVLLRLVLSPLTPEVRVVGLPDVAIRWLWRVGISVIYVMGYGQFWVVPVVSSGVSVFVGRATAAVLSTLVVAGLIVFVLRWRRGVADWLASEERTMPLAGPLKPLALRWHWPVLAYLFYVLITVMTRPGNVLVPLLVTTSQVALVIVVAAVLFGALAAAAARRLRVPDALALRLPLLEERLNQLVPAVLRIARLLIAVVALVVVLEILGLQTLGGLLTSDAVERLSSGLFSVFLIVAVLSVVWLGMTSWVDYRLNPFVGSVPTPREITLLTLMKNAATVAIIIIGGITSLAQLGMNVGPLIASAGVIGLAISFGAQRMVEDIFSGIFIQAEGAMNVGDVVDVGGTVGTVEKLTVRSVTLRDLSGVVHVIPFSSAAKISNYMREFSYHVADIGVAYRENVDDVRQAMNDAFDELRRDEEVGQHVIGDLEWFGLNAFGASELVMRARIKTAPGQQWGVGRAYNGIVKRIFDERGIEIPFPHQTLYFGEDKQGKAPPLHMRIERERAAASREETPRESEPTSTHQTVHGTDMPASDDP
ncbi:mechanosensitive ion channel protein MscS [Rhodovulum sp. 12E13]|uniref:mechanosensitive ion channel domain-containing protein n=1 Tax=Rhodovulum sp. 12E13 TaxID=2203891 RepID=UPI000E171F71|nr:mechanosensitive ion channel domain-containing protein [Rhodovulum sp. 12E13]RDC74755.1 mechanosensitive ion channel protein MscS [Rhodovulum sp. 12E13]